MKCSIGEVRDVGNRCTGRINCRGYRLKGWENKLEI